MSLRDEFPQPCRTEVFSYGRASSPARIMTNRLRFQLHVKRITVKKRGER